MILIGGVTFHYFAGFTGGRKLICPGLAFVKNNLRRRTSSPSTANKDRVATAWIPASLDGNAVHEAFMEAAAMRTRRFAINTIVNDAGEAT